MEKYSEEIEEEEEEISVQEMHFKNINKLHQSKEAHSKKEKANIIESNPFTNSTCVPENQKPINFIWYQNRFDTNQEAMDILEQYQDKNIAFVSIFGRKQSGKTTLVNKLLDVDKGCYLGGKRQQ
ncbi:hypothetical protein IMG5_070500 [Ichthyophthirius multifiliis]|uniref:Guanylate-binding protein N-terminal domain-containing protein n=1 Tax=Ichthyophthirius multifiliis TaxID=5932 RepID=G0QPR3_ICHMU|nr:hypothetical protein IMG5_070500 [Ichthyophthirius multifiliis]EGR32778.1 hypothetical protein IMG5_070500 [Ichthyophthirius multifiliis]|eukprot:XP_004036764.1 hypothetical protein IMG5_070500 [Ichthyophthirius multifiliis]